MNANDNQQPSISSVSSKTLPSISSVSSKTTPSIPSLVLKIRKGAEAV